ncbi:MAG: hypothetical protein ACFB12_11895 [Leptolyngbyaceae cyanobacterium]
MRSQFLASVQTEWCAIVALIAARARQSSKLLGAIAAGVTKWFQTDKMIMIFLLNGQLGQPPLSRRAGDTQGVSHPC